MSSEARQARGSEWHRWDPHIHTPGTVLSDQYRGEDPWGAFLTAVETSDPPIEALGVTDYLSIKRYQDVVKHKAAGRLANVGLVFPNVEMRFGLPTRSGSAVNVHLLFSPESPNHVEEIERFLGRLSFETPGDTFRCTSADLIRLGRIHKPTLTADDAAHAEGTNQFKVTFEQLRREWRKSEWVQANGLVAVAGGADGTSGMRDDKDSFAVLRANIESFAHIVFASSPKQVAFWLGKGAASEADLEKVWGGKKPCLHGSDAHHEDRVGLVEDGRRCWIKGALSFESLQQAWLEPEGRTFLGPNPPSGALPSHTVREVQVTNADWLEPNAIPLNPGLIAIVGARGSGKTALADLIAAAGHATKVGANPNSFLDRAQEFLANSDAKLTWADNDSSVMGLIAGQELPTRPYVQYLSQQFVDTLCSADGLTEPLVEEIERVVFESHPVSDRLGADSFAELLAIRSAPATEARNRCEEEVASASGDLLQERKLKQALPSQVKALAELKLEIEREIKNRGLFITKGGEEKAKRQLELLSALDTRRHELTRVQARLKALEGLRADVLDLRDRQLPTWLNKEMQSRADAGLTTAEWSLFRPSLASDWQAVIDARWKEAKGAEGLISGQSHPGATTFAAPQPLPPSADLTRTSVATLEAEIARIGAEIGADAEKIKRLGRLNNAIAAKNNQAASLVASIERAKAAEQNIKALSAKRSTAYEGVMTAVVALENELKGLYSPLSKSLETAEGSLKHLRLSVARTVDLDSWCEEGEELLDLRRAGPFKGRGTLKAQAQVGLLAAWESGSPQEAANAMRSFIKENEAAIREHRREEQDAAEWAAAVSRWLHSTSHIKIAYSLQYDGVDIRRLSPGTRGIVLLLLYLAIDDGDQRPLIIDQPEENLDPQSVFDELVERFKLAKRRRQIIVVTHNANLVVNTDADQIIVATSTPRGQGELPIISYEWGGLEDSHIRKRVCAILEGGERAFLQRARRLRVRLDSQTAASAAGG